MTNMWGTTYWANDPLKSAIATWAAVATIFAVVVSVLAAFLAWRQFKHAKTLQDDAFAKSLYAEQLKLDLAYPQFSVPNYWALKQANQLPHYDTFLSHLLWAMEEILAHARDRSWPDVFKGYLAFHHAYLARPEFKYGDGIYTPELVAIIREAATNYRDWLDPEPLAVFDQFKRDAEREQAQPAKKTRRVVRGGNVDNG